MGIVNLVPRDYIVRRMERRIFRKCLILFPIVLVGILAAAIGSKSTCTRTQELFRQTSQAHDEAVNLISRLQQVDATRAQRLKQVEAVASLLQGVSRSYVLASVADCLGDQTSLTRFELDAGSKLARSSSGSEASKGAANAPQVRICGLAADNVAVGRLVATLSKNPLFSNVDLLSNQEQAGQKDIREFQIALELKPAAAATNDAQAGSGDVVGSRETTGLAVSSLADAGAGPGAQGGTR